MSKFPTFPLLYDNVIQINISKLKQLNYLQPKQIKNGKLNWSKNGNIIGSISMQVNTHSEKAYIELNYNYKGETRSYKIYLTAILSNLKKGEIWYFICPKTKKRCRILYLIEGYFFHREAFSGCMYWIQTQSKQDRAIARKYKPYWQDNEFDKLQSKHFKYFYNGKPTKRYLNFKRKIEKANQLPDPLDNILRKLK